MKKKLFYLSLLSIAVFFVGCYPEGAEYVDELDTVISQFDHSYNFESPSSNPKTYIMPDSIVHYKDGEEKDEIDHEWDVKILDEIEKHFETLGYERKYLPEVEDPEFEVDLHVYVGALVNENSGYYWWDYYYDYWGWYYPGWGYPGYPGWGYPGWGYPVYYSYTTGSLIITMTDPNNLQPAIGNEDEQVMPIVYVGGVNGLLQGSDEYRDARITVGLNDLFNQVPFN